MRFTHLLHVTVAGLAAAATLTAAGNSTAPDVKAITRPIIPRRPSNALQIVSPIHGEQVGPKNGMAHITVGKEIDVSTLRILINGKDMTQDAGVPRCGLGLRAACDINIRLTPENGVEEGQNRIRVMAIGKDKHVESTRVKFHYKSGILLTSSGGDHYLPDTVGLKLNPGGALPWATITTGYKAGVTDPVASAPGANLVTPYSDTSFPSADQACGGQPLQVLVLDRANPLNPQVPPAFTCVADVATLKQMLADRSKVPANSLVIAGTTQGHLAPASLDTTAIGGTDFSKTSDGFYPKGYVAIGIPDAAPGTAYENYYTGTDLPQAIGGYAPWAHGTLAYDGAGHYNFISADNRPFSVTPNDRIAGTSVISIGSQTYTAPPNSQNGFWLLVVDGAGLQPIDGVWDQSSPCPVNAAKASGCGTFFPTGSSDPSTAADAVSRLGQALMAVTFRQVAFLTTVGQPFQTPAISTMSSLGTGLNRLGGARYTLTRLATPDATYTLVAPGLPPTGPVVRMPFDRQVVTSSNAYTVQGQTGAITGVLAQRQDSIFAPVVAAQVDGQQNSDGATVVTPEFSMYMFTGSEAVDWPLTDTPGHLAAYHYVSNWILQKTYGLTGPYSQDVRYFYSDLTHDLLWTSIELLDCSQNQCPMYPTTGDVKFQPQDLQDAIQALHSELLWLRNSHNFLDDSQTSLRSLFTQSGENLATEMIAATHTVTDNQLQADQNAKVTMKPTDWIAMASAITAVGSAALGPSFPAAGAVVGVLSGLLSFSGAVDSPFENKATAAAYESGFDTTLGELSQNAPLYTTNLLTSYDTALETIFTDSGRLNSVYLKLSDTGNGGWTITPLQNDALFSQFSNGVSRTLYTQLVPQVYSLDTYPAQPVQDVTKLGTFQGHTNGTVTCNAIHASLPDEGYQTYAVLGALQQESSKHDIFVIAGQIHNQGKTNVSEDLPSQGLLDTLFGAPGDDPSVTRLSLPKDMVMSTNQVDGGFLTYRGGPDQGYNTDYGLCYKPGCDSRYIPNSGSDPYAACRGPE